MISSQDFDRLSAYLDNQLSPKETAVLEARLAREPELKATLDELRQTVRALRSLPVVKLPRNFMLSAKQAGAVPQRQWFPTLRLATSLAALTLVLVFAGDFIVGRAPAASPAGPMQFSTAQRNAVVLTAAPPALAAMPAASAPAAAPTQSMDQSGGRASGSGPAATPLPEANTPLAAAILAAPQITSDTTASTETGAPAGAAPPTTAGAEPTALAKLAPTEAPAGTLAAQAPASLAPAETPAATEAPPSLAPTETETSPTFEPYSAPTVGRALGPVQPPVPSGLPWRGAEISLIGLTLLLAALTWLMRRR
jgi:hypothetical protein